MNLIKSVLKQVLEESTIVYKKKLGPSAYHIRLSSDSFKKADFVQSARIGQIARVY